jgi:hypothetical protein
MAANNPVIKLFKVLFIVGLLSSLVIVLPAYVLNKAGELKSVDTICQMQKENSDLLWGCAYIEAKEKYKLEGTKLNRPNVLALGNSRSMPFRKEFFNQGITFYNAGGGVKIIPQYKVFLENIEDIKIDLLLINIDDFMFAPNWSNLEDTLLGRDIFTENNVIKNILSTYQLLYQDFLARKIPVKKIISHDKNKIGFFSIIKNSGFRSDGSRFYGDVIADPKSSVDYQFKRTIQAINDGTTHYVHANKVNEKMFSELDTFLTYCDKRNIQVLAFMPPFAPTAYKLMEEKGDWYSYKIGLYERVKTIFNKHGYNINDYTNAALLDGVDEEFVDGHHGGERMYAKIAVDLANKYPDFAKYLNKEKLEKQLKETTTPLYIFEN